jgi:hypothetical protein
MLLVAQRENAFVDFVTVLSKSEKGLLAVSRFEINHFDDLQIWTLESRNTELIEALLFFLS